MGVLWCDVFWGGEPKPVTLWGVCNIMLKSVGVGAFDSYHELSSSS